MSPLAAKLMPIHHWSFYDKHLGSFHDEIIARCRAESDVNTAMALELNLPMASTSSVPVVPDSFNLLVFADKRGVTFLMFTVMTSPCE